MKIFKISKAVLGLTIVAGISSSSVFAMSASDALDKLNSIKDQVEAANKYRESKNYDDLPDSIRGKVENACKYACGRFTCGNSGKKAMIKAGCRQICPEHDVKNCLKA